MARRPACPPASSTSCSIAPETAQRAVDSAPRPRGSAVATALGRLCRAGAAWSYGLPAPNVIMSARWRCRAAGRGSMRSEAELQRRRRAKRCAEGAVGTGAAQPRTASRATSSPTASSWPTSAPRRCCLAIRRSTRPPRWLFSCAIARRRGGRRAGIPGRLRASDARHPAPVAHRLRRARAAHRRRTRALSGPAGFSARRSSHPASPHPRRTGGCPRRVSRWTSHPR
jgi:hypothetical protein